MNRKMRTSFIIGLITVAATLFVSCGDILVTSEVLVYTNVKGNTLNAMAPSSKTDYWVSGDQSLEGATISFYPQNSDGTYSSIASNTTTVNYDGTYSIGSIGMRKYKVQGEKPGWVFVPKFVDIAGEDMDLGPLSAYLNQGSDTMVILLSWEDKSLDLDGVLTYYDSKLGQRSHVGWKGNTQDYSIGANGAIERKRDVVASTERSIPRVETILVKLDTDNLSTETGTDYISGKNIPRNQLRYYVNNPIFNGSVTGVDDGYNSIAFSNAVVDIMYGTTHYGGWTMPWNTAEKTLHIANIDVSLDKGFTIYSSGLDTDMRSINVSASELE